MSKRLFLEKAQKPDTAALEVALGPAFASHRDLTDLCGGLKQEWVHTRGSGWMLKVADGKKALCYVIPLKGSFRVSMAIREAERATLLESEHMADYWALLTSAETTPHPSAMENAADHLRPWRSSVAWCCWRAVDVSRENGGVLPR